MLENDSKRYHDYRYFCVDAHNFGFRTKHDLHDEETGTANRSVRGRSIVRMRDEH